MNRNFVRHSIALALVMAAGSSIADTLPAARIAEMMRMPAIDTDKDGMVSKAEFVEMAAKAFDMAAKEFGAKNNRMTATQLLEFRRALATP